MRYIWALCTDIDHCDHAFRAAVTSTLYVDDLLQSLYDLLRQKVPTPELVEIHLHKFTFELTYGRGTGWEPYYLLFIVKSWQDTNPSTITTNGELLSASCLAPPVNCSCVKIKHQTGGLSSIGIISACSDGAPLSRCHSEDRFTLMCRHELIFNSVWAYYWILYSI